jgi:SAM-dependent methyltransferase
MNRPSNPHFGLEPSPWFTRFASLIPAGARVLDVACGYGRHARFFAAHGAHVVAVDRDASALATLEGVAGIEIRLADLEAGAWPFAGERVDAVVVSHYLHRPLFPLLRAVLADDGALLYETFAVGNEAYGKPSNPAFLLRQGELLELASAAPAPMTVVAFEQGLMQLGDARAVLQRLAAVGSGRLWPPSLGLARRAQ